MICIFICKSSLCLWLFTYRYLMSSLFGLASQTNARFMPKIFSFKFKNYLIISSVLISFTLYYFIYSSYPLALIYFIRYTFYLVYQKLGYTNHLSFFYLFSFSFKYSIFIRYSIRYAFSFIYFTYLSLIYWLLVTKTIRYDRR